MIRSELTLTWHVPALIAMAVSWPYAERIGPLVAPWLRGWGL